MQVFLFFQIYVILLEKNEDIFIEMCLLEQKMRICYENVPLL